MPDDYPPINPPAPNDDEPTRILRSRTHTDPGSDPTERPYAGGAYGQQDAGQADYDPEKTRVAEDISNPPPVPGGAAPAPSPDVYIPGGDDEPTMPIGRTTDSDVTQLLTRPGRKKEEGGSTTAAAEPAPQETGDLVRGWLVVTDGPGRGQSVVVGTGNSSVGRDRSNRIALPFGDKQISRENHALVVYDPVNRDFWLNCGMNSINLTYRNGAAVMSPTKLEAGDKIAIGETKLRFVPLCGPDFDWEEDESAEGESAPAEA